MISIPELYTLVSGLGSSFKAILFGSALLVAVIVPWLRWETASGAWGENSTFWAAWTLGKPVEPGTVSSGFHILRRMKSRKTRSMLLTLVSYHRIYANMSRPSQKKGRQTDTVIWVCKLMNTRPFPTIVHQFYHTAVCLLDQSSGGLRKLA